MEENTSPAKTRGQGREQRKHQRRKESKPKKAKNGRGIKDGNGRQGRELGKRLTQSKGKRTGRSREGSKTSGAYKPEAKTERKKTEKRRTKREGKPAGDEGTRKSGRRTERKRDRDRGAYKEAATLNPNNAPQIRGKTKRATWSKGRPAKTTPNARLGGRDDSSRAREGSDLQRNSPRR